MIRMHKQSLLVGTLLFLLLPFFAGTPYLRADDFSSLDHVLLRQTAPTPGIPSTPPVVKTAGDSATLTTPAWPYMPTLTDSRRITLISASPHANNQQPLSAPQGQQQLLQNPGFDNGQWTPWQIEGQPELSDAIYHSSPYSAWLGGYDNAQDVIYQTVTIPANTSEIVLDAWAMVASEESQPQHDRFCYDFIDETFSGTLIDGPVCGDIHEIPHGQWLHIHNSFSGPQLAPLLGKPIWIIFFAMTDSAARSSVWLDDITLTATTDNASAPQRHTIYLPLIVRPGVVTPPAPSPTQRPTDVPAPTTPVPPQPSPTQRPTDVPVPTPPVVTTYIGTATMDVWYKGTYNKPPYHNTYQQSVRIKIGPTLIGEDGTAEENPFYYEALPQSLLNLGAFTIVSAGLFRMGNPTPVPGESYYTVNQWWSYTQQGERFSGNLMDTMGFDTFNRIVTEDLAWPFPGHRCLSDIKPGATIDIVFIDNRITTRIAGTVYDSVHPQACTALVERFELQIEGVK